VRNILPDFVKATDTNLLGDFCFFIY